MGWHAHQLLQCRRHRGLVAPKAQSQNSLTPRSLFIDCKRVLERAIRRLTFRWASGLAAIWLRKSFRVTGDLHTTDHSSKPTCGCKHLGKRSAVHLKQTRSSIDKLKNSLFIGGCTARYHFSRFRKSAPLVLRERSRKWREGGIDMISPA